MLQRVFIHLSLVLLFAFTQMGVATHSISHLIDGHEQHQQDQNHHENQCGQCLSLSHIADANLAPIFDFQLTASDQVLTARAPLSFTLLATPTYSARAPPYSLQV